jgi:hypothetical protein
VAISPDLPPQAVARLLADADLVVRQAGEIVGWLASDPASYVRMAAAVHPNSPPQSSGTAHRRPRHRRIGCGAVVPGRLARASAPAAGL